MVLWDHVGEAYDEYEKVAEMMLKLERTLKMLRADVNYLVEDGTLPADVVANHATIIEVDTVLRELNPKE